MVPEQGFALIALTNSEGGPSLIAELFLDDLGAADLHRPEQPARGAAGSEPTRARSVRGRYEAQEIAKDGTAEKTPCELRGHQGQLRATLGEVPVPDPEGAGLRLVFYRKDYVLVRDAAGRATGYRANFLRDGRGRVEWLGFAGRLYHHNS